MMQRTELVTLDCDDLLRMLNICNDMPGRRATLTLAYQADREIELNLEHLLLIVKVESDEEVAAPVPTIPSPPLLRIVSADVFDSN